MAGARVDDVLREYMAHIRRQVGSRALARKTTIPVGDISKAARGKDNRHVTIGHLQLIADGLDISMSTVFADLSRIAAKMEDTIVVQVGATAKASPELADELDGDATGESGEPSPSQPPSGDRP